MAQQGIHRREALRMLGLAAAASRFPGFSQWVFAGGSVPIAVSSGSYQARFFTPAEYADIELLADLILPEDDTPGAMQAGVPEFIDFMVFEDRQLQLPFRSGLKWLNAHARALHGESLGRLSAASRNGLLEPLAFHLKFRAGEERGREFFALIREYTVMGYYTSRIGLEALGYPGLQQAYASCPECPHPGDPEHRHLPAQTDRR